MILEVCDYDSCVTGGCGPIITTSWKMLCHHHWSMLLRVSGNSDQLSIHSPFEWVLEFQSSHSVVISSSPHPVFPGTAPPQIPSHAALLRLIQASWVFLYPWLTPPWAHPPSFLGIPLAHLSILGVLYLWSWLLYLPDLSLPGCLEQPTWESSSLTCVDSWLYPTLIHVHVLGSCTDLSPEPTPN